jgi:predicted DNA-binding transcriptional regulator AlpA
MNLVACYCNEKIEMRHIRRKIIRRREVCAKTGYSSTTIWRMEGAGRFPRRVLLNPEAGSFNTAVGWYEDEVDEWIQQRIRVAGRLKPEEAPAA